MEIVNSGGRAWWLLTSIVVGYVLQGVPSLALWLLASAGDRPGAASGPPVHLWLQSDYLVGFALYCALLAIFALRGRMLLAHIVAAGAVAAFADVFAVALIQGAADGAGAVSYLLVFGFGVTLTFWSLALAPLIAYGLTSRVRGHRVQTAPTTAQRG